VTVSCPTTYPAAATAAFSQTSVTVIIDPGEAFDTDITNDTTTLRCRGAVSDSRGRKGARTVDLVALRRDTSGAWRARIMPR
jgi:hypothetical protein